MVRRALIVLCIGVIAACMASCGQTYKLDSITIAPAAGYILTNAEPQGALVVTANYSNTKTAVVTVDSKYEIGASALNSTTAPLNAVSVNNSGVVTASGTIPACTYSATASSPYTVNVSYTENGVTASAQVPINVSTAPACN